MFGYCHPPGKEGCGDGYLPDQGDEEPLPQADEGPLLQPEPSTLLYVKDGVLLHDEYPDQLMFEVDSAFF